MYNELLIGFPLTILIAISGWFCKLLYSKILDIQLQLTQIQVKLTLLENNNLTTDDVKKLIDNQLKIYKLI